MRKLIAPLTLTIALGCGILLSSAVPAPASGAQGCPTSTTGPTGQTGSTGTTTGQSTSPPAHPLNQVVIENCQGGTKEARSRLQVGAVDTSNAQPTNVAIAYSHDCASSCQSIAAAFQVVLVEQGARVQAPQNAAVAVNQNCTGCGAFAYAHQYALDVPEGTTLWAATRRQIAQIRRQAAADVRSADVHTYAGASDLDTKLKALASQLEADVNAGLRNEHVHATHRHSSQHTKESGQG
jgi:hypothetical protein